MLVGFHFIYENGCFYFLYQGYKRSVEDNYTLRKAVDAL